MINLIAAIDDKRGIGSKGKLPWHLSEDLIRFKEITKGYAIIMGRNTFESIGKPLPDRRNIVITQDPNFNVADVTVVNSIDDALDVAKSDSGEVFIIGGAQIFVQTIDLADKLYLTQVEGDFNCDTFFPDFSVFKNEIFIGAGEANGIRYKFLELTK